MKEQHTTEGTNIKLTLQKYILNYIWYFWDDYLYKNSKRINLIFCIQCIGIVKIFKWLQNIIFWKNNLKYFTMNLIFLELHIAIFIYLWSIFIKKHDITQWLNVKLIYCILIFYRSIMKVKFSYIIYVFSLHPVRKEMLYASHR